jgi:DNA-binding MurR/RpiR family transcriptional regulator
MLQSKPPSDYEELIRTIHERYDEMSRSDQRIAVYLTQNPNDVAVRSVHAIAERCEVHASNVVRFAQALGYDGFKTLH